MLIILEKEVIGKRYKESGVYKEAYLKDHLGNIRATVWNNAGTPVVVSAQDYYPFGSTLREYAPFYGAEANKFKYQGKELDAESGYFDFEARPYDKDLGRFTTVDPMREKGTWITPYAPIFNNPTTFIDKNGKWPSSAIWLVKALEYTPVTSWILTSHEVILKKSLSGVASNKELQRLIKKQTEADEDQSDENQYKHFLDSDEKAWAFVNNQSYDFKLKNDFGTRLHAFMDFTSPSHTKDGEAEKWKGTSIFHKAGHVLGELNALDFLTDRLKFAEQMTSFYYNWEKNGSGKLDKSCFTSYDEFSRTGKMNFRVRSRQEAQGLIDSLKRMGYDVTYNGEKQ